MGKKSRGKRDRREERGREEAARPVEVRDDVGWEVLLDGTARVVVCGEGTPFGAARDFQMSVSPAARSRGLEVSTRKDGDNVHLTVEPGPRLGERTAQRATYRWDEWLNCEQHVIGLGPDSEFPGVRAQQLVDAAHRAAKTRGLQLATQVRDGGLTVVLQASPTEPFARPGKYPWDELFNGDEHHIDLTDEQWGHPQAAAFRASVRSAAKRRGVCAHVLGVVGSEAFDPDQYHRARTAAGQMSKHLLVWADRPNGSARTLGLDRLADGQPHAFPVGPGSLWPDTTAKELAAELVRTGRHYRIGVRYRVLGHLGLVAHTGDRPLELPGDYPQPGGLEIPLGLIINVVVSRYGFLDLHEYDLTGHDLSAAEPAWLNLDGTGWDPDQPPRWPGWLAEPPNQWGRPLTTLSWRYLIRTRTTHDTNGYNEWVRSPWDERSLGRWHKPPDPPT